MRKILLFTLVLAFGFFVFAGSVSASPYTLTIADLQNTNLIDQGWTSTATDEIIPIVRPVVNVGGTNYVQYSLNSDAFSATEAKVGIGDSFDWDNAGYQDNAGFGIASMPLASNTLGDLSSFTSYDLIFYNPNSFPIHVNPFMNTGNTDVYGPTRDQFYENGWTLLGIGGTATLSINFATVQHLDEVSNIGFMVALPSSAGAFGKGTGAFNVNVAPVPIPSAVWLFASGLLGLIGVGRFRFGKHK